MDIKNIMDFLSQLKVNNNREWFNDNRDGYKKSKDNYEIFIDELIPKLKNIDESIGVVTAKECVFRIFRDVRFSKDKTPYKPNFGAFIASGGRKSVKAGYYVHLEDNMSFAGGGIYMPQPDVLKKVRNEIYFNADEFNTIISSKEFKKYFVGLMEHGKLKNGPKDFPKDFPYIDLLKYKSYAVGHNLSNSDVLGNKFSDKLVEIFESMLPLNQFINRALD